MPATSEFPSPTDASVRYRVLVIGGYGFFGRRLVERLSLQARLHVIVAGRSAAQAEALVASLGGNSKAGLEAVALDANSAELPAQLDRLTVDVLVLASGPFQGSDYRVALACAAAGVHYVDLADGRAFVAGIADVDVAATAAGVCVISGASSVPGLSSAAIDSMVQGWQRIDDIDIGISPGNRIERGHATMHAVLTSCGQPIAQAGAAPVTGWLTSRLRRYPAPVGWRLLSPCDVPDLAVLPDRYPGRPAVRFGAGLELMSMHLGMNLMAAVARVGLVRDWSAHTAWLKRRSDWLRNWGSGAGAMHVAVRGLDAQGGRAARTWTLVATDGDGPYTPTLAAAALVRKLAHGEPVPIGARPCVSLLTLADFEREAVGLRIEWHAN
jgi:NAD(P)-dependent dehydrogenase (short-subunit alcohol dehydrogenase family)